MHRAVVRADGGERQRWMNVERATRRLRVYVNVARVRQLPNAYNATLIAANKAFAVRHQTAGCARAFAFGNINLKFSPFQRVQFLAQKRLLCCVQLVSYSTKT